MRSRLPRQPIGEGLVPVTIMVPAALKARLLDAGITYRSSLSAMGRLALEAFLDRQDAATLARDTGAGE